MKITKSKLNRIIKEELAKLLLEHRPIHTLSSRDTLKSIVDKYHMIDDYGSEKESIRLLKKWNINLRNVRSEKSIKQQLGRRAPSKIYLAALSSDEPAKFANPIAEHNAKKIIEHLPMPGFYIRYGGRKRSEEEGPSTDWNRAMHTIKTMIDNFPLLQTNKIIKKLGEGVYGTAFLLDNDHVLKFFMRGAEGVDKELEIFKDLYQQQWNKPGQGQGASADRPAIYDFGRIPKTKQYFVEMSQLISLKDWFNRTQRTFDDKIHGDIMRLEDREKGIRPFLPTLNSIIQSPDYRAELIKFFDKQRPRFKAFGLTDEEINQYYDAIQTLIKRHGSTRYYDVHLGNVGVLPQRGGKPDKFIIFDF